jgi:hypothetical protein
MTDDVIEGLAEGMLTLHTSAVNKYVQEMAIEIQNGRKLIKELQHRASTADTLLAEARGDVQHLSLKDMAMVGIIEQCPKCAEALKTHWVTEQEFALAEHWRCVLDKLREGKKK